MDVTPKLEKNAPVIESYGPLGFRIGGVDFSTSLLLTAEAALPLGIDTMEALTLAHLEPLLTLTPPLEILLIGTGPRHALLDASLRQQLRARGLNADTMDTGAACRTFNVLLGEARLVGAMLLKLPD